jgi:putative endonuclease
MRISGSGAERLAAMHLALRGWRILERNWRWAGGELDIVALRRGVVAVIEVKARTDRAALADPVSPRQLERIVRAARAYVARAPHLRLAAVRVDVVLVDLSRTIPRMRHVVDVVQSVADGSPTSNRRSSV